MTRELQTGRATAARPLVAARRAPAAAYVGRERGPIGSGGAPPTRLLGMVRECLRLRRYSARTSEAYVAWIRRYVRFCDYRHPQGCGDAEVRAFLRMLMTAAQVSASTQNQALAALRFLYAIVLQAPLELAGELPRARQPERLPSVLSRDEVRAVLAQMRGAPRLLAALLYGSGLRLMEACTLRVKDVDFSCGQITVRRGKGGKDRVTMLPASVAALLGVHLSRVRALHGRDGVVRLRCRMRWRDGVRQRRRRSRGSGYFRRVGATACGAAASGAGTTSIRPRCSGQ